jgi:hypothetical protein
MNKGIVMEINESNIIVMTSSGRFDKLPKKGRTCEVGEEIVYAEAPSKRSKFPPLGIASGLVAAIVLCFVLITGLRGTTADAQVVAYVSIDINPSVELGIDSQEIVRDLRGLNTDGIQLIVSLDYQGKKLETVLSAILDKAEQGSLAKGEGDIVISSTIVQPQEGLSDEAIADKLRQQVAKHIAEAHPNQVNNYEVTAFAAPLEIWEEAKVSGVSAGKYAVYLNALSNGTKVSLDDLQAVSIHQLAQDNGGITKLVDPAKPITKSSLKILLDDEKSGKLAERLKEKERSNTSNKTDKSESGKNNDNNDDKSSSKNNGRNSESSNQNSSWNNFIQRDNSNQKDANKNGSSNNDISNYNKNDGKDNSNNYNRKNDNRRDELSSSDRSVPSVKPSPSPKTAPSPKAGGNSGSDSGDKKDRSGSGEKQGQESKQKEQSWKKSDTSHRQD